MKKKRLLRLVASERERADRAAKGVGIADAAREQERKHHAETRERLQRTLALTRKSERAVAFLTLPAFGSISHCPMCDEKLEDIQVHLVGWVEPETPFTKSYTAHGSPFMAGGAYGPNGFVRYSEWFGASESVDQDADTPTHLVYQCGCGYIFRTKTREGTPKAVIT
ncbi:hypothetical protein [Mycobacteroides abscessus]|uniref:hypothetical protein n=1 Tax=Mycobacteroides abscessus TaxID=36809 RepID=UPI00092AD0F3|nr:hypothetical protein [Mycobacteroides abscessus]DAZ90205.1 TPA_asm: hypothetical protein PROPHIFSIL01-1_18 [Mycobacterium phage prophiFSIL01-1]SHZ91311.1 Uncharacterised protein [Mycobacteroides abscessus subsp. abscessus]SIA08592.1 Uncharacterised protein [Mycobacteroides abscessus subsp. abscessus]SIA66287.1 Uncharacterised protein [Mycobacteroides abscessus subsp. abscessus]SIA71506.1 Uncharacterised protein [Mycobacteroides abscessus subsp. abscessus]